MLLQLDASSTHVKLDNGSGECGMRLGHDMKLSARVSREASLN
jgi:hypothetical protein